MCVKELTSVWKTSICSTEVIELGTFLVSLFVVVQAIGNFVIA